MENFDYEIEMSGSYSREENEIEIDFTDLIKKKKGGQPTEELQSSNFDPVEYSSRIVGALQNKLQEYNKENNSKLSVMQLREVYKNGLMIFSSTDIWSSQFPEKKQDEWAMARVNMFLRMRKGDTRQGPSARISSNRFLDISATWCPIDEDFLLAKEEIEKYNLKEDKYNVEDLYLDVYEKERFDWE